MKRQVIGFALAVILAAGGTIALVAYVRSAKDAAIADEQLVPVYVVSETVAKGTPASELATSVELTDVPQRLVVTGAVTDLAVLDQGDVTAIALQPGEQLLADRLVDPQTLVRVTVPDGMQEITIELSPERAVGGELVPGDTVGALFSFDAYGAVATDPAATADDTDDDTDDTDDGDEASRGTSTTHLTVHKVLVTAVQLSRSDLERSATAPGDPDGSPTVADPTASEAPGDRVLVTLAVTAPQAEQFAFAAEFGRIWLTAEGPAASEDGTRILTYDGVYVTVPR